MRLLEQSLIMISEDLGLDPKRIRFKEQYDDSDLTLIAESLTRQESFAIGTHIISLGSIAQGRFLLVKPTNNCQIQIDGGAALTLRAGKVSRMWVNFTSLSLIVSTIANQVTIVAAGE